MPLSPRWITPCSARVNENADTDSNTQEIDEFYSSNYFCRPLRGLQTNPFIEATPGSLTANPRGRIVAKGPWYFQVDYATVVHMKATAFFLFVSLMVLTASSSSGQGIRVGPDDQVVESTLSLPFMFYNENLGFAVGYVYGVVGRPQK